MADFRASGEEGLGWAGQRERSLPGKQVGFGGGQDLGIREKDLLMLSPRV